MSNALPVTPPFVGRELEQKLFLEFLTNETQWVLVVTGLAGNGKSTLLRFLAKQVPDDTLVIILNFAVESIRLDPINFLRELARQIEPYCDLQKADLFKKTLNDSLDRLSELNTSLNQTIYVGNDTAFHGQGMQLNINTASSVFIREQHRQVRDQVAVAFYTLAETFRLPKLVIMLDTYEWLSEPESLEVGQWVMSELIPGLHERLQQGGNRCYVVIASRVQPQLDIIDERESINFPLLRLEQPAVDAYLLALGMNEDALRQHIYSLTYGHPFCLSIIGALWQEQGLTPLNIEDLPLFKEKFNERLLLKFIQERILDKRLKSPFSKTYTLWRSFKEF